MLRKGSPRRALSALRSENPAGEPPKRLLQIMELRIEDHSIDSVHIGEDLYPPLLAEAPDPPAVLFLCGDQSVVLDRPCVALIGSRRCSLYGRRMARRLAGRLASSGLCVVSGLARGIDGECHAGALAGGGVTAAVLGSGVDVIYPRENAGLARRVLESGCILSEYPPGTPPKRFRFPQRNRIISGLSMGVVVIEAGSRSGTMITVSTALDQGREVMAVPGDATRSTSVGTNRLIREGAAPVTCARDVLEVLGLDRAPPSNDPPAAETDLGRMVLEELAEGAAHVDQLARATGASLSRLREELLRLELAGRIISRPGGVFALV